MTLIVDIARPEDAPAMAAILSDWIDETGWMPRLHTRAEDRAFVASLLDSHTVHVVRTPRVAGFLARRGGEIDAFYVSAGARRTGIGSALLEAARAAASPLSLWTFQANEAALRFYTDRGFVEAERSDGCLNEERLPDIRLVEIERNHR